MDNRIKPLQELFARVAQTIAEAGTAGACYQGRRVMAIDGVVLDVADTRETSGSGSIEAGQALPAGSCGGVAECGTHVIVAAAIDSQVRHSEGQREIMLRGDGR